MRSTRWTPGSAETQAWPQPRTTARVLLADDPDGWPEGERPPSVPAYQLWTRLRVALLGAI